MTIAYKFADVRRYCEQNKITPRFHGNGFVQLDLSPTERFNVWPQQRLHIQKVNTQIHDHRFSFKSRVIAGNGKLLHRVYAPWFTNTGDMDLYAAVAAKGQNTRLEMLPGTRCFMVVQSETRVWNEYTFEKGLFHETVADGLVMTLMEKTANDSAITARIACHWQNTPDNDFDRHNPVTVADCWDIIRDGFAHINRNWVNPYQ